MLIWHIVDGVTVALAAHSAQLQSQCHITTQKFKVQAVQLQRLVSVAAQFAWLSVIKLELSASSSLLPGK
jgi:hypothetical protein